MAIEPRKNYNQTPSKLRVLWDTAKRLIGEYEDFDRRIKELETKIAELSYKLSSMADKIKNV